MTSITLPHGDADADDITAITQVILLERECRDHGRWERMRQCFNADSLVRVSWFSGTGDDFVTGSIDMVERGMLAKHRLGPILVRVAGSRAVATLGGIIDIPAVVDGVEANLASHARFYYRLERKPGRGWLISGFDGMYLRDELTPAVPGTTLNVPPDELTGLRKPYRLLAWLQIKLGYRPSMELPGVDRPDRVEALEAELFGWAGIEP